MPIKLINFNYLQRVLFCTALAWRLIYSLGVRTVAIGTLAVMMSLLWSAGDRAQGQQLRLPGVAFQPQSGKPTFRSGVELVRITAVVQDRRGRPVLGLLPSDFQLDVSGEPVQIVEFGSEASGVSLALLIDDSGSMSLSGRKDAAQEVAKQIVTWLEAGRDEVTLLGFDKHLRTVQPFTTQPSAVLAALAELQALRPHVPLRRHRRGGQAACHPHPPAARGGGDHRRGGHGERAVAPRGVAHRK